MSNNLFCISKKTFYLLVLLLLFLTIYFFGFLSNKKTAYKTSANSPGFSCTKIGKYEVQDQTLLNVWVADCQSKYGRTSAWNGSYGSYAKCYTKTAICANIPDCIKHDCLTDCLYEEVDIGICVANGNPREDPTKYTCPPSGEQPKYAWYNSTTCYEMNGQVMGLDQGKKPYCGSRTVDINYCQCYLSQSKAACSALNVPTPANVSLCLYGGYTITFDSKPYYWRNTKNSINPGIIYKCIFDKNGNYTGARCKTNRYGDIIAQGSVYPDYVNCPVPTITSTPRPTPTAVSAPLTPTAYPHCSSPISCQSTVPGSLNYFYYYYNGHYYSDFRCTSEINQGVGNYCKGK